MPAASAIVISRAVAVKYYTQVPVEPIPGGGSVEVKKASVLPKPTMITLLQFVARTKPRNLVIVAHGEGGGITVRLAPSSESALVSPHLGALVSSSGKVTADLAKELGISMANLKALQEAAAKVRALKLGRVDFRACTLGEFADSLELLRAFFGAGAVSAPKKLDEFGGVSPGSPTTSAKAWREWASQHPFGKIEGAPPNRVGFETFDARAAMQVESNKGLRTWLDAQLPGHLYKAGPVYYHGLLVGDGIVMPGNAKYRELLGAVP